MGTFRFDNSYTRLPHFFYVRSRPQPVEAPRMVLFNTNLASSLGLDAVALSGNAALFTGNELPEGSDPIAQAYAGHQFGYFNMLGDGRAILLGEHILADGTRVDIQLKGSGRTAYSRSGDGRAALGPMLREYIISEAMFHLGIPTTRSLAVAATGEGVMREDVLQGAVLTRVAASHVRVGTFEFAAQQGVSAVKELADYVIARHYPQLATEQNPYLALLNAVMQKQAELVSKWQGVGFIHGVMNTDNMSISGETIDYGPCAFMNAYDIETVFSSIDKQGRYAYANQPPIAQWNLARFAETLLPLLHEDAQQAMQLGTTAIQHFQYLYGEQMQKVMSAKLGLRTEREEDVELVEALLQWMQNEKADYTNTFRYLSLGECPAPLKAWHAGWQERLKAEDTSMDEAHKIMLRSNPAIIPRNHKVEEALKAAEQGDMQPVHRLMQALSQPYADRPEFAEYTTPPGTEEGYRTFCGT